MTSMREKIAERLIARRHGECRVTDWQREAAENPNIADALADADAVLDAMEEPTTQMLGAAADYSATHQHSIHGAGYWQAMILAAKEGK